MLSRIFSFMRSSAHNIDVKHAIQNAINDLNELKSKKNTIEVNESVNPSIDYLSRNDVYIQASELVNKMLPCKLTSQICNTRGVYYLELTAIPDNDLGNVLVFWPCSECACIELRKHIDRIDVIVK